jgi:hypothetical protein
VRSALPLLRPRSRWEPATGNSFEPRYSLGTTRVFGDGNVGRNVAEHACSGGADRADRTDVLFEARVVRIVLPELT